MKRALLLDRNYMALSIVPWRKAIKLMVKGKAEAVQGSDTVKQVTYARDTFEVPSIIRLVNGIPWRAHIGRIKFSRRNLIIRDSHQCQYCGRRVSKTGTIDHVIPKSRGGKTDFANCVLSCGECNNYKANKTPEEAGMRLMKPPKKPTFMSLYKHQLSNPPDEWCDYIIGLRK